MEANQVVPSKQGAHSHTDEVSKRETLEKIVNLEQRISAVEREKCQLYNKKHEFHNNFSVLEESEVKCNQLRKTEKQQLRDQVNKIRSNVDRFKQMLIEMKPGPSFVEELKALMEDIEVTIVAFKERQREVYENLLQDERAVAQEVSAFEKKLLSWAATGTADIGLQIKPTEHEIGRAVSAESVMPPAVIALDRFLVQTGGRQGGWDNYDHQTFLRIWRDHKISQCHQSFLELASHELPTKTISEIEQHEKWYSEYCTLLESQKKAINEWKAQKEVTRLNKLQLTAKELKPQSPNQKRQQLLQREQEERFAKLSQWKADQLLKKAKIKEKELQDQIKIRKEMEREQKERAALKLQVEEFVKCRALEDHVLKEAEEARKVKEYEKRKTATRDVKRFRDRDLNAVVERKKLALEKEAQKHEKEKRLERLKKKVELKVSRDPSRLLKETAGWSERIKNGPGSGMGGMSVVLPKRGVPSWRQGL